MRDDGMLVLSGLLLLEAVALEVARTETLGALIGVFAAYLLASILRRQPRKQS
jgi:hypothetical protein